MMLEGDAPVLPTDYPDTSPWDLHTDFHSLTEIGKGKDTIIYSAIGIPLGNKLVAVKVYDKQRLAPTKVRAIKREIAMMLYFMRQRVPNVVEFYGAFQDESHYYIVMEYCEGGDLLEKLLREKKAISERRVAVHVAIPVLITLNWLHGVGIIHRDIKLENIFIDGTGHVKLGDFGLTMSTHQEAAISPVGTVEYMAPEVVALPPVDAVVSGQVNASDILPNTNKVDIWALGVTLFELVTGRLPFEGRDKAQIKTNITEYRMAGFGPYVSPQCQDFIKSMLSYNPADRPSAAELLQHSFLAYYRPKTKQMASSSSFSLQAFTPNRDPAPEAYEEAHPASQGEEEGPHDSTGPSMQTGSSPLMRLMRLGPRSPQNGKRNLGRHGLGESPPTQASSPLAVAGTALDLKPLDPEDGGKPKATSVVQEMKSAVKRIFSRKSTIGTSQPISIAQ